MAKGGRTGTSARQVIELQLLGFKAGSESEGIRLTREFWEILRRKPGCAAHRLYRPADGASNWLVYSEWRSIAELGGARRELARAPIYRRIHSMIRDSSERAYEPFGAVQSIAGASATPASVLIAVPADSQTPEDSLAFLSELAGHRYHLLMREVTGAKEIRCLAGFADEAAARVAIGTIKERLGDSGAGSGAELYLGQT